MVVAFRPTDWEWKRLSLVRARLDGWRNHMIQINACVYCGQQAEGNYLIERDGMGSKPALPLCDACGGHQWPTLQDIWARVALLDDDGTPWGPTVHECDVAGH